MGTNFIPWFTMQVRAVYICNYNKDHLEKEKDLGYFSALVWHTGRKLLIFL